MSNFNLSGVFYFSGTLTYDVSTDTDPLMDFYAGPITLTANYPSSATGFATATDNCTLFPVIGYSDANNGGSGCLGDPLIITRTWTATDDCGNVATCVQTITVEDTTPPTFLSVPDDLEVNAEAGGCTASFTAAEIGYATATDNCNPLVTVTWARSDGATNLDDPFDAGDSPITITWKATDDCGLMSTYVQTVIVHAVNDVALSVQLTGSIDTITPRCIHFVADDCSETADVELDFDGSGYFSGTVEIPCGNWTALCAKDEQHTKWATTSLSVSGTEYVAGSTLVLNPGDTDNDGDVDINDVTWLVATYGFLAADGGCGWTGVRDADFDNGGDVGTEDYTLLSDYWLTVSSCGCLSPFADPKSLPVSSVLTSRFDPWVADRADLNRDGIIDFRDVRKFELMNGLPDTLSTAMLQTELRRRKK
jgi:hypothetical protein